MSRVFGERVSPGPANQRSFLCLPCCWGQMLKRSNNPWSVWLMMLCLSPYQRVFYALASWCPSRRTYDFSKRRGLIACVQTTTPTANFCAQIINWSLPAAPHSDLSAHQYKGVIPGFDVRTSARQHVFRGCIRSYSATASLRHREGKLCGSCGRKTHLETV